MSLVNIIKGSIRNVVDEKSFERLYKPNGWQIDNEVTESDEAKIIGLMQNEESLKNFIAMTNKKPKTFDDNLFFSERKR